MSSTTQPTPAPRTPFLGLFGKRRPPRALPTADVVVPIEVHRLHTHWQRLYRTWWAGHYALGMLGAIAGVLVASKRLENWEWFTGLVIALTTTLVTFLGPLRRAQAYYRAFHLLDQGCLERRINHITDSQLCAVVADAREIVLDRVGLHQPQTIEGDPRFSDDPRQRALARKTAPPAGEAPAECPGSKSTAVT